jgi:hypothetical protein
MTAMIVEGIDFFIFRNTNMGRDIMEYKVDIILVSEG